MISLFTEITATTVTQGWTGKWLLAAALFLIGKGLVLRRAPAGTVADRAAFTLLWPGMDYAAFTRAPQQVLNLAPRGLVNLLGGMLLVWGLARLVPNAFAATWTCMAGFIWALHGGVFTLLAAFWRRQGRDVTPLLRAPLLAGSVTEFWGRRIPSRRRESIASAAKRSCG